MTQDNLLPLRVPEVMRQYGIRPDKRYGQVFLADGKALQKITDAAEIEASDTVLEIGSGLGNLTQYLARVAKQVVAVEIDDRLIPALEDSLSDFENIKIIHGDILKISPDSIIEQDAYIVAANIPYYITSAIIRHILKACIKPRRIILTIQKEVAQRVCAYPGMMNLLALSVQVYGRPQYISTIRAQSFIPVPDVDSAVLRIDIFDKPYIPAEHLDVFFELAKAAFNQKRKKLRNSLSHGPVKDFRILEKVFNEANIDINRRPETLSLGEWRDIVSKIVFLELDI